MTWLLVVLLSAGIQAAPAQPSAAFVGKWTSTDVPPPGNAPLGPPSFIVEVKDGKTLLTFDRQPAGEPIVYTVAPGGAGRLTLFLSQQTPRGVRLYLVCFLDAGRADVDLFMASSDPTKPGAHVPLGIYTKGK